MEVLHEDYVLTAGDLAAVDTIGRGYNCGKRTFESVNDSVLSRSWDTRHILRGVDVWLHAVTTGLFRHGIVIKLYTVHDPTYTGHVMRLPGPKLQGGVGHPSFRDLGGAWPMGAGVLWRIQANSILQVGDWVSFSIYYERGR